MSRYSDNVRFVRPEVSLLTPRWTKIRDCLDGNEGVKAKGTTYLPQPNPEDTSDENQARYTAYKARAVFYNVTRRTRDGLVGEVFMQEPEIGLEGALEPLFDDIDGRGVSAQQQAKKMLGTVLAYGRCGALADYPSVETPTTVAEQQRGDVRPTVSIYEPWQVINWRTETVGGARKLSLVVIRDDYTREDGAFASEVVKRWRALRLVDGMYTVEVWEETDAALSMVENYIPSDGTGSPLTEIPFVFVGWQNSDPEPDSAPLLDMANLNLAHYRNSADYEESCFLVGQPTLVMSGLTEDWVETVLKGQVLFGSRSAVPLPTGGAAALLQAAPNTLPFEAMGHKEKQLVALGAKLVEDRSVQRTATEAGFARSTEISVLASAASNVSEAYRRLLKWCRMFANEPSEPVLKLSDDISVVTLGAQEQTALIGLYQAGVIAKPEAREVLRRVGIASLDDAEADAIIDAELDLAASPDDAP